LLPEYVEPPIRYIARPVGTRVVALSVLGAGDKVKVRDSLLPRLSRMLLLEVHLQLAGVAFGEIIQSSSVTEDGSA
jgi:hypothetical protein